MKRIPILLILLVFAISGCSKDRNPLEDEPDPGIPKLNTPEVEYNLGQGEVVLSWERRENAEKYIVCKKLETDDEYKPIGTPSATEFRDTDVEHNATYQYIVAAITGDKLEGYDSYPATVTVSKSGILEILTPLLDFKESYSELKLKMENIGGEGTEWQISSDEKWITFSPERGEIPAGKTDEVLVRVDRGSLKWGKHLGKKANITYSDFSPEVEIVVVKAGILGTVVDSRKVTPIHRAQVSMNEHEETTNPAGEFAFAVEKYGSFKLLASKDSSNDEYGYIPTEVVGVRVSSEEPVISKQIQISPIPKSIEPIRNNFDEPTYIAFSRNNGARAYVTNNRGNNITVINTSGDGFIATIPVGERPIGIAANRNEREVYVANNWSNSVSVIDIEKNEKGEDIDVGSFPTNLVASPDGNRLYVVNSRSNDISVIDINQRNVIGSSIKVGTEPYGIAITSDGAYLYVTNGKDATVSIVDVQLRKEIKSIYVGQDPADITLSPDDRWIYVSAGFTDGKLTVINAETYEVTEYSVGVDPRGLVVLEDVVYVVVRGENMAKMFDARREVMIQQTIEVGMRPRGIATNGQKIYVANSIESTVSVLEFP